MHWHTKSIVIRIDKNRFQRSNYLKAETSICSWTSWKQRGKRMKKHLRWRETLLRKSIWVESENPCPPQQTLQFYHPALFISKLPPLSINLAFLSVPGLVHGFILVWQHSSCPYPGCLEIPANDWTDPPPAWFYHRFQGFFISRQNCLHSSPPPQVQTTHAGFLSILKHIKKIIPKLSETKLLNPTTFNIVTVNAILSNYWRCTSTNSRENPNGLSWS